MLRALGTFYDLSEGKKPNQIILRFMQNGSSLHITTGGLVSFRIESYTEKVMEFIQEPEQKFTGTIEVYRLSREGLKGEV